MLERTYYELVVNFNVFGTAAHQAETRLYFDLIRSGGENNFLHFMPPDVRTAMRNSWYQGSDAQLKVTNSYEIVNEDLPVQIAYRTSDPKAEFVALVSAHLKSAAGPADVLNRCTQPPCYRRGASAAERQAEASLQTLASKPASLDNMRFVDFHAGCQLPAGQHRQARTRTWPIPWCATRRTPMSPLCWMKKHAASRTRIRSQSTAGCWAVTPISCSMSRLDSIEAFTAALHAVRTREQFMALVSRYGLSRTHPQIWANFHWFVDYMRRNSPVEAGVYDMNRYKKVADLMADETG